MSSQAVRDMRCGARSTFSRDKTQYGNTLEQSENLPPPPTWWEVVTSLISQVAKDIDGVDSITSGEDGKKSHPD